MLILGNNRFRFHFHNMGDGTVLVEKTYLSGKPVNDDWRSRVLPAPEARDIVRQLISRRYTILQSSETKALAV